MNKSDKKQDLSSKLEEKTNKISNIKIAVLWLLSNDLSFFIDIKQFFKI